MKLLSQLTVRLKLIEEDKDEQRTASRRPSGRK